MSDSKGRKTTDPLIIRGESGRLILPQEIAAKVHNFEITEEGTLITVRGPCPYIPKDISGLFPSEYANSMPGIFHATLSRGTREILLLHSGDTIYTFEGWKTTSGVFSGWKALVGPSSSSPQVNMTLPSDSLSAFPTQFEATPIGVIIIPQHEGRAIFYDGYAAAPLGYDTVPSSPQGIGPNSSLISGTDTYALANGEGYSVDRSGKSGRLGLHPQSGKGRLGTTERRLANNHIGALLGGIYQAAVQWVDRWGNFSAISQRSNSIQFDEEECTLTAQNPTRLKKQVVWSGIDPGPERTIGRILCRTRDTLNSGTQVLYIVPGNAGYGVYGAFATLPDNVSDQFPDNVPDGWLVGLPNDVMPIPHFKLCRLAFGRLWIANTLDDPGLLVPSMPGRYGTFLQNEEIYPDPSGGEITGLWNTRNGLLVFTATTSFLVIPSDDGKSWIIKSIHRTVGCVAPSSICTLQDGRTIWLSQDGFYSFDGESIIFEGVDILPMTKRINKVRAKQSVAAYEPHKKEYRCWVPMDGSRTNNLCFIFDGSVWRQRRRTEVQAVCVTKDHLQYMLATGRQSYRTSTTFTDKDTGIAATTVVNTNTTGVWVVDHEVESFEPQTVDAETSVDRTYRSVLETSWITWTDSHDRKTAKTIYLNFRETANASARIRVYRDWRKGDVIYSDTSKATFYTPEDLPAFWGTYSWDDSEDPNEYSIRRPFWKRVDIEVPSCEVYKIVIDVFVESQDDRCEFVGMMIDEEPKVGGFGSRIP